MAQDADHTAIRPGMATYGADGELLGPVEEVREGDIRVLHHVIPSSAIARVDDAGVHLLLARAAFTTARGGARANAGATASRVTSGERVVVPLAEERLSVTTRETDLGEVFIRKRVIEEERLVPVVYRREEVEIIRREAGQPWPAGADEAEPGVEITRIALRGQEPVLATQPIVTREVVIEKVRVAEERQISDTIRKQRVDVDERYRQARPGLRERFAARQVANPDGRTFEQAEPQYRAGFNAASDLRYDGREFDEVEESVRQDQGIEDRAADDQWARLRAEIRGGWDAARGR